MTKPSASTASSREPSDTEWFLSHEQRYAEIESVRIAYRVIGSGPPLLLFHGWPFSSLSFRKIVRRLGSRLTCILPDTPGLGDSEWSARTDFGFRAQAERLRLFAARLGLERYAILGHDTGATLARQVALGDPARAERLVLFNTEIPGHRPPWIPLFQRTAALPGNAAVFRLLLRSRMFRRSPMGYGGCFSDPALIDDPDFLRCFVEPLLAAPHRIQGVVNYLGGVDWELVDGLAARHAEIAAPVLLVWGADDPTFPVARARAMLPQFAHRPVLREISPAKLLLHEEQPERVAAEVLEFLAPGRTDEPAPST